MKKLYYKNKIVISLIKPFENKRLFTSLKLIILTLKHNNLWPQKLIALDAFCQTGLQWTRIFSEESEYLEMWDINSEAINYAKKEFPHAIVNCGNSIEAFETSSFKRKDFNFILIDTPLPFQYKESFEHFGFFECVFSSVSNEAVIILNVAPSISLITKTYSVPNQFINSWAQARSKFYNVDNGMEISPNKMIEIYSQKVLNLGYKIKYINYNARNQDIGLITIVVQKHNV